MSAKHRMRPFSCFFVLALLGACAESTAGDPGGSPDPGPAVDAGRKGTVDPGADCAAPQRYAVSLTGATCTDLESPTGVWSAAPRFADVPESVRDSFCDYSWLGGTPPSDADRDVVLALEAEGATVGPLCNEPDDSTVEESFEVWPAIGGAIGCDVCKPNGLVHRGKLFAVLPPFSGKGAFRTAYLRRPDGNELWISFAPPRGAAQRTVIVRLPAGEAVQEGRVSVE